MRSLTLLLSTITRAACYNSLFVGHSFFVPIGRTMEDLVADAGVSHTHQEVFSAGASGTPSALWASTSKRNEAQTILDVGITHPTIDTCINNQSSEAPRGSTANKMAASKNRRANKIIEEKDLDIDFKAITFTTFGGFGKGTHDFISKVTSDTTPDYNLDPWVLKTES